MTQPEEWVLLKNGKKDIVLFMRKLVSMLMVVYRADV